MELTLYQISKAYLIERPDTCCRSVEAEMKNWVFLGIAIVAEVIATSSLQASDGFRRPVPVVLVVAGFGTAFYFLSLTLRVIPVGVAYAVWAGVGVVLITLVAWALFDQKLDWPALVGIGLIVAGVVVLNVFSQAVVH